MKNQRPLLGQVLFVCCMFVGGVSASHAASCDVNAQSISFGAYDLINALDSSGTITVSCTRTANGAEKFNYTLALSVGAGSISAREMTTPGSTSTLLYNLYSDASRTIVWGDGTNAVTGRFELLPSDPTTQTQAIPVHGRIFANQSAVDEGVYSSPVPITVTLTY